MLYNYQSEVNMLNELSRKDAIDFLGIDPKHFDNYFKSSEEIKGYKKKNRWYFDKSQLIQWNTQKEERTVFLDKEEYEQCFEFAIKMAYGMKGSHGTGIRGVRSEMQTADDFILGIMAEVGIKKMIEEKFNSRVELDMEVHPDHITEQDFVGIYDNNILRKINFDVAVKSSKWKSCWNILPPIEYEDSNRRSDVYIFARVGIPSDHLFRVLRNHSFFNRVSNYLNSNKEAGFRTIEPLGPIPIWICGFNYHGDFHQVTEIPGQKFDGNPNYRYACSVSQMKNSDTDWKSLLARF